MDPPVKKEIIPCKNVHYISYLQLIPCNNIHCISLPPVKIEIISCNNLHKLPFFKDRNNPT